MKRLRDLEIHCIVPDNKYSNKQIDNILSGINSIIYFFYFLYINTRAKETILSDFRRLGKELSEISLPKGDDGKIKRKNELLSKLRNYYKKLNSYVPDDNEDTIKRTNQYLVSQFIKEKKEKELTELDDFYMEWLRKTKDFSRCYNTTLSLKTVNKECQNWFNINDK